MTPRTDPTDAPVEQDQESSGPPYRALAMILLTLMVVAVGVGLVQLLDGDTAEQGSAAGPSSTSSASPVPPAPDPGGPTVQTGPPGQVLPPDQSGVPQSGTQAAPQPGQPGVPQPGTPDRAAPVRILNNSTVVGLAGRTGDRLKSDGFAVSGVTNYPSSEGVVPVSIVYYGTAAGEQATAEAVAATLGIRAEPRPATFRDPQGGVVVIVTQDLQR